MSATSRIVVRRAITGLRWTATFRIAAQLLTWALTILVVRLLTPEDYGLVAMAGIALNLASVFDDIGLGAALIQRPRVRSRLCHGINGVVVVVAMVFLMGLWLIADPLAVAMAEPRVATVVQASSLAVACNVVASPSRSLLIRHMRFATLGAVDLLAAVASSVTSLGLALAGQGVWALVAASLVNSGLRLLMFLWLSPCRFVVRFGIFREVLPLMRFGAQVVGARFFEYGLLNLDKALVGRHLGSGALGQFSVSQQLARIPLDKGTSMLTQVAYPAFSRLAGTEGQGRSQLTKLIGLNSAIFLPMMWTAAAISIPVLPVVLGQHWTAAAPAFAGFAIVVPFQMTLSFLQLALMARGRADVVQRNSAMSMVLTIGGVGIGLRYGIDGAVAGWVLGNLAGWSIAMVQAAGCLGIRLPSMLGAALLPAIPSFVALLVVWLALNASGSGGDFFWSMVGGCVGLGAAYIGFAMIDRTTTREVMALARRFATVSRRQ